MGAFLVHVWRIVCILQDLGLAHNRYFAAEGLAYSDDSPKHYPVSSFLAHTWITAYFLSALRLTLGRHPADTAVAHSACLPSIGFDTRRNSLSSETVHAIGQCPPAQNRLGNSPLLVSVCRG